ncbi:MAG: nucleoside recognition protein [Paludibacteraceae bacterium]|nr:nucleoside recognition protein [Paludibacteraceae bacterium]
MTILRNALKTALWIIRIIIPVSFVVTLLDFYGVIEWISAYTAPLFQLIGLQGNAAIVYFSSLFLPLYAPIAIIATLPLTLREITILALMCLITHNLPIECAVQRRSGTPFWQTLVIRITFSILGGILLNLILPESLILSPCFRGTSEAEGVLNSQLSNLNSQLINWLTSTLSLCIKIILIITALMYGQFLLKRYGIINKIAQPLAPFMRLCGLQPDSAFLWLVAQIVGLTYGAGIMAQEIEESGANREELHRINLHICVNHSLIEDTAIFCMLGVAWYFLVIPRLIFAIIIVNLHNLIKNHVLISSCQKKD